MKKDDKKLDRAHHIKQIFQYQYKNQWASQSFINSHDRLWIQTFNSLVKQGFIEKKKIQNTTNYRWKCSI